MEKPIEAGEDANTMTGTPSQIEWAQEIRLRAGVEFNRVAAAFQTVAAKQTGQAQLDTHAVIAMIGEKRSEVMGQRRAGYYIREWQELSDQVRRMIAQDSRYQSIQANRKTAKS